LRSKSKSGPSPAAAKSPAAVKAGQMTYLHFVWAVDMYSNRGMGASLGSFCHQLKCSASILQGASTAALPYFICLGFQLPANENPADFFLDVVSGCVACHANPDFQIEVIGCMWDDISSRSWSHWKPQMWHEHAVQACLLLNMLCMSQESLPSACLLHMQQLLEGVPSPMPRPARSKVLTGNTVP